MTPLVAFLIGAGIGAGILLSLTLAYLLVLHVNWWRVHQWADRLFKSLLRRFRRT